MIEQTPDGLTIHGKLFTSSREAASIHFGVPVKDLTPDQVKAMKNILFPYLYGTSLKAIRHMDKRL